MAGSMARGAPCWSLAAGAVLIALGFAGLLASVHAIDVRILLAMRPAADPARLLGPPAVQEAMRDLVGLGGVGVLVPFIAAALGALWLAGRRSEAARFAVGVGGAFVLKSVLKRLIARPRPEVIPHDACAFSASFPSGHALMATVVWLLLAFVIADAVGRRAVRRWMVAIALVIAFAVGVGRVYLGVHWPSDVVAAWGLGIVWVWLLRRYWRRSVNGPR